MDKAREDVKKIYVRNDLGDRDENDIVNIGISLDGAFSRHGRESTYCVSVAIDVWTGRPIDFHCSVKCFSCKNCDDYEDNGNCPYGLFHGPSGSMELYNALVLFGRSETLGFRYTTYVADGDSKILPHLLAADPYPGYIIQKVECGNHLGKRGYKAIVKFGETYTQSKGEADEKREGSRANRGRGRANRGRGRGKGRGGGRGRGRGKERGRGRGKGRGREVRVGETAAAAPDFGPMDRFINVDPEVERILSPFTDPSLQIQPDTDIPLSETPDFQNDTESAAESANTSPVGPNSTYIPTQDTPSPTQDTPAPTHETPAHTHNIQSSTHDTTTPTHDSHTSTYVASTSQTRSASTKRKAAMWLGQVKPTIKKPPVLANQPSIVSALRSAARREAAPVDPRVIDNPQDELNGCFVFEGLTAVAQDDMLDSGQNPEVIAALLEDWESDESVSGQPAIYAATSPSTSADPSNGPSRVSSMAPEASTNDLWGALPPNMVSAEPFTDSGSSVEPHMPSGISADTTAVASAPGRSDTDTLGPLYVNHDWPLPDFLKEYHHRPRNIYKIKPIFAPTPMYRIQNKYRLAVYKHRQEGPDAQHRAVMSVVYHECDHPQTSLAQREWYHRYCDDGCGYQQWVKSGKSGETFSKKAYTDAQGKLHDWKHGTFAGLDTAYPLAFKQLVYIFDKLGNRELMARCRTLRTQNANESIHSKIFNIVKKIKDHGSARFNFGCQQVMLDHNYGVLNASLLNCLGTMSTSARQGHDYLVREGNRSSKRVYGGKRTYESKGGTTSTGISHRKKLHHANPPRSTAAVPSAGTSAGTSRHKRPQQSGSRFTESGHYSYGGGD